MLLLRKTFALAALLVSFCAPTPFIRIHNSSKQTICYKVEYSNGTGALPNDVVCGGAKGPNVGGFQLSPGQIREFRATGTDGTPFDGAITAVLNNNTSRGARNEINFLDPSRPWYDVDYQYGISDGTCGPADGNGSLAGEHDTLGKANTAWQALNQTVKNQLLAFPQYIRQDGNGSLVHIDMALDAWPQSAPEVIYFFQVTAGFKAYMSPGSVAGVAWPAGSIQKQLVAWADRQPVNATTNRIVVTSY